MHTRFIVVPDPTETHQKLLICSTQDSFLTVVHRDPGMDITLSSDLPVYSAFYGPNDGMLIVHFTLHDNEPGAAAEIWPDELLLEAIRFYNEATGLTDLMMVHQYKPIRVLFESEHSLMKQRSTRPEVAHDEWEDGEDVIYLLQ